MKDKKVTSPQKKQTKIRERLATCESKTGIVKNQ